MAACLCYFLGFAAKQTHGNLHAQAESDTTSVDSPQCLLGHESNSIVGLAADITLVCMYVTMLHPG